MIKKLLLVCANSIIAIWFFLLWCNKMLLASDIPINISYEEMKSEIIAILVSTAIAVLYVKLTPGNPLYYFLIFPTFLWGFSMTQSFMYNYHKYDTIMAITGFLCSTFIWIVLFCTARRTATSP
ncbi:hypothetical protein PMI08_01523 [Brevibacillus sp. CF112]|uniref:Uncharacterized protein n=1 Tax=Brevibacillus agri TaxID=51101 RepID=A0A3M8B309_9BACL|nr:hypothetical protein PMI08_01523 [Brevibacillus sp. CF112]ELK43185.1 hypothetical protein D478_04840 [Brevibacillus agri BAB-2500]MBG9568340.1 hypothetical protein [Brevibacillus agri]QAV11828.1 hypothetical protein BA6348_03095 [Brevibacillus agri]RNB57816.1 hypothetical protein EB820_06720 [Brevibacillus agri]